MTRKPACAVLLVTAGLLWAGVTPAGAAESPADLPVPTPEQLARSVHQWDPSRSVRSFEVVETDTETTTITLSTDILFASQSYDLPDSAGARIAELLAEVPDGAAVQVHGHTDSLVGPIPNEDLAQNRAQAVADVIAAERPGLTLEVAGFADTQPAVRENPNDESTYAANRRVEIIYEE